MHRRSLLSCLGLALLGLLFPGFVAAEGEDSAVNSFKDDYAQLWPVETDQEGLFALTLEPSIYGQVERRDLADLAAFNGAGEALAFEALASVIECPQPEWRSTNIFAQPAGSEGEQAMTLQVVKDPDGSLSMRAETRGDTGVTSSLGMFLLVDTGVSPEQKLRLQKLDVEMDPEVEINARVRVDASSDLQSWRTVAADAALLQLVQDERTLRKQHVEIGSIEARYLRIRRVDMEAALPIAAVRVEVVDARAPEPAPPQELAVEAVERRGDVFLYRLPSRIPIASVDVRLADENLVATARISSREDDGEDWWRRGSLTAFRLRAAGVELDNEPLSIRAGRERWWRVETEVALDEAPKLVFRYRPERWALLTRGEGPYVVAAGSVRAVRERLPLKTLMAPIRAKYGDEWQPPEVALGDAVLAAGDKALEPTPLQRWSGAALWALLIGSALAIAVMVVRLIREQNGA